MTLFQNFIRYSGDLNSTVAYCAKVATSGMNLRFTVLEMNTLLPDSVVANTMP